MILALLISAAAPLQCTPADFLCDLGRSPTYSEQEQGRLAAERQRAEREVIERQAAATRASSSSQAAAARALPNTVDTLTAAGRCDAAADAALVGGDVGMAQQVRTYCKR
ncbi:hypothetical protein GCM10022253_29480 [Sphingomonas endophytica]|uniref:Membrane protein YqiK n=1 Tax=Sphingomonas endophytica TaxID=869719 RepID=A0ABR6N9F9_9SPHN|nr:hypothetical protein [Sphingomonas endophytica]MBB5726686.1 putative membrane protein YqiK [Sphingomonas endophytica]